MYKLVICLILIVVAIMVLYNSPKHNVNDTNDTNDLYNINCSNTLFVPNTRRRLGNSGSLGSLSRSGKPLRDPERLQQVNQEWKKMPANTSRQPRISWRDEETSKELASVQTIPNRYGDLPDVAHLRPFYNPGASKLRNMANNAESGLSDLTLNVKSTPDISMVPDRSVMFEND